MSSDRVQEVLNGEGDDIGKLLELFLDVKVSAFPYDEKLMHYQTVGLGVFELSPKELCLGIEDKEYGRERLLKISERLLRGERLTDSHRGRRRSSLNTTVIWTSTYFISNCCLRKSVPSENGSKS
ncbi:MAG: hypothetical protein IJ561_00975 [Ruminococcus sp.]|nr:hypothetical protein [Ruminococcus sp.]